MRVSLRGLPSRRWHNQHQQMLLGTQRQMQGAAVALLRQAPVLRGRLQQWILLQPGQT